MKFSLVEHFYNYKNICIICNKKMTLSLYKGFKDCSEDNLIFDIELKKFSKYENIFSSEDFKNSSRHYYLSNHCKNHMWYETNHVVDLSRENFLINFHRANFILDKFQKYKSVKYLFQEKFINIELKTNAYNNLFLYYELDLSKITSQKQLISKIDLIKTFK